VHAFWHNFSGERTAARQTARGGAAFPARANRLSCGRSIAMTAPPATPRTPARIPPAEHPIDAALVRALLGDQQPALAEQRLELVAEGWDNAIFRLGEELAVRLPRRALGAALLDVEQRWLPIVAPRLPVATPTPVFVGEPGQGFPWRWSVVRWLEGASAERAPLTRDQGSVWGGFLKALHHPAPADAPFNPHRSITLRERAKVSGPVLQRLAAERPDLVGEGHMQIWTQALAADVDLAPTWIHGDLHARNVITRSGVLAGVIDWGDMASGDPAMDLYSLWMVLPDVCARQAALAAYGPVSEATLARARGWAVAMGAVVAETAAAQDPVFAQAGERALQAVIEGP
jgi:aminoglycoside phosphotransferase (APT) family kinase protein